MPSGTWVSSAFFAASDNFPRLASLARYWGKAPSDYLPGLTSFQRFLLDEAAAIFLEETAKEGPPAKKRMSLKELLTLAKSGVR